MCKLPGWDSSSLKWHNFQSLTSDGIGYGVHNASELAPLAQLVQARLFSLPRQRMMASPMSSILEDPLAKAWENFVQEGYIPIVLEASQELGKVQDSEKEPFQSKWLAIEKPSN